MIYFSFCSASVVAIEKLQQGIEKPQSLQTKWQSSATRVPEAGRAGTCDQRKVVLLQRFIAGSIAIFSSIWLDRARCGRTFSWKKLIMEKRREFS
jgi:hypothetical protein